MRLLFAALLSSVAACTSPVELAHCPEGTGSSTVAVARRVTWHQDVQPIVEARCVRCHRPNDLAPFSLTSYREAFVMRESIRVAVKSRSMPPWMPAKCCNQFRDDHSLSDEQIALIEAWVNQDAPEGDPATPGPVLPPIGGLSRADVRLMMREPYTPAPPAGRRDDFRCFWIDWPLDRPVYVTGLSPIPGARAIVHHLVVGVASGEDAEEYAQLEPAKDGRPGVPCAGFGELPVTNILGGSLVGGDFPEGIGQRVDPGSKIVLSMHYSMSDAAPPADQTSLEFKIDELDAKIGETKGVAIANPAWLVSDAMLVRAGEKRSYAFQFDPGIFTGGDPVLLRGVTPHMHYLGDSVIVAIVRGDGRQHCLLDIPRWDFGWEQPYWFNEPVRLEPGDEVIIRCVFDNTQANQPLLNGVRPEPRDIAWGTNNQDMCAGFLAFTPVE